MGNPLATKRACQVGRVVALALFWLGILYVVVTAIGLLTLQSSADPIGDPWFSTMEVLILVTAPLMVLLMVALHLQAAPHNRVFSLAALVFMGVMAGIMGIVHFTVLAVSRPVQALIAQPWTQQLFSFTWPSVIYGLDILAWDVFYALSALCAALLFGGDRLGRTLRILFFVSGGLSLVGLAGPFTGNMQIRDIGIIGYALVFTIACLPLSRYFRLQAHQEVPNGR